MAKLNIEIGAKTTGLQSALGKVKSSLSSFGSSLGGIWGKLATGISVGAVIAKANATANAIDDLKDRSDNLGMPTDQLQRWEFAANDAGLGSEKFGKALNGLNSLIQDTSKGGAAGLAAIEKLAAINLDPSQLQGKSFNDQLGIVFDSLAKVTDKQQALAAASDIFGAKIGSSVLGLAANWRTLKDEVSADKLFTPEDITAAENFTKAMAQLENTIQKTIANSGLLDWLSKAVGFMDKLYNKMPTKAEYGDSANATSERDVAYAALKKTGKYTKNTGYFFKPNYTTNIPEADINQYLADRNIDPAKRQADRDAEEKTNAEKKLKQAIEERAAAEKLANEKNIADTIKRLESNSDVQGLAKITGKPGLTDKELESLNNASSVKERFALEQQITAEKKKQIEIAKEEKKKADDEADAKQSITDSIAALEEKRKQQELINAGKSKEAYIEAEITKAKQAAKRELTDEEKSKISNSASALYDVQQANSFKGAQGSVITDQFSKIGGAGGKLFGQDNTPKLQLAAVTQSNRYLAEIQSGVKKLTSTSTTLRAP